MLHRAVEDRWNATVDVAVFVQKVNTKEFRLPPVGRIAGPILVRFRSLFVFANANASAVEGDDNLFALNFPSVRRLGSFVRRLFALRATARTTVEIRETETGIPWSARAAFASCMEPRAADCLASRSSVAGESRSEIPSKASPG
jgi:hypothetical protein